MLKAWFWNQSVKMFANLFPEAFLTLKTPLEHLKTPENENSGKFLKIFKGWFQNRSVKIWEADFSIFS